MLNIDNINVFYGDLQALRNIKFHIGNKEIVSIIGANGTGKSTTLRTISGILRSRTGKISFKGEQICRMSPSDIVKMGICHVPEGRQVFPNLSVIENLEMGAQFSKTRKVMADTLEEVFHFFPRLKERLQQKAGTLSGGEQQMLAMGRGLMSKPDLIMFDEPSLGLAPIMVSTIFDIIRKIHSLGTAILLIEQNVYNALKLSDRAYVLENGRISMKDRSNNLLENPHIRKTYLGL